MISVYTINEKNLSTTEFDRLYSIIIKAYADTESAMWGENYVRVSKEDFKNFWESGEVLAAFYQGRVAGGLRYREKSTGVFNFSLFGADFSLSGKGIGRTLIERVEQEVKRRNGKRIEIEILRPRDFELPIKTGLHKWYQQLGYRFVGSINFEEAVPDKAKDLLVPCVFDQYVKTY